LSGGRINNTAKKAGLSMLQKGKTYRGLESTKKFISPENSKRYWKKAEVYRNKPLPGKEYRVDSIYDVRHIPGNANMADTLGSKTTLCQMRKDIDVLELEI